MPQTVTTTTTESANVLASKRLMAAIGRQKTIVNLLTQDPIDAMSNTSDIKMQTDASAPVILINDLTKSHGTTYSFDMLGKDSSMPIMGNDNIDGFENDIRHSSHKLQVNASRYPIKKGGYMVRQSYGWSLNSAGRTLVSEYHARLQEQRAIFHLAGNRGFFQGSDIILPLSSHAAFDRVMVNDVTPPTHNRTFYPNDKTSVANLVASDTFNRKMLIEIRRRLDQEAEPMMGVSLRGDLSMDKSLYVMLVTPNMWADYKNDSNTEKFEEMQANALSRTSKWTDNALFKGEMFVDENILCIKYNTPVRFNTGDTVNTGANNAASTLVATSAPTNIECGIIIGGQALAMAYGRADPAMGGNSTSSKAGMGLHIWQDTLNAGAEGRITATVNNGCNKIVMINDEGYKQDRGVSVAFCAVSN